MNLHTYDIRVDLKTIIEYQISLRDWSVYYIACETYLVFQSAIDVLNVSVETNYWNKLIAYFNYLENHPRRNDRCPRLANEACKAASPRFRFWRILTFFYGLPWHSLLSNTWREIRISSWSYPHRSGNYNGRRSSDNPHIESIYAIISSR